MGIIETVGAFTKKNSSSICVGLGVVGFGLAVVHAVKRTPKYLELKEELYSKNETLNFSQKAKIVGQSYWPIGLEILGATLFVTTGHVIDKRTNIALAATCELSNTIARRMQDNFRHAMAELPPEKQEKVQNYISEKAVSTDPPEAPMVLVSGFGDTLFKDMLTGRYFKHEINKFKDEVNRFNRDLSLSGDMCWNDFFDYIGLEHVSCGYDFGWSFAEGELVDVTYGSTLTTNDCPYGPNIPCITVDYDVPAYNFR